MKRSYIEKSSSIILSAKGVHSVQSFISGLPTI